MLEDLNADFAALPGQAMSSRSLGSSRAPIRASFTPLIRFLVYLNTDRKLIA
jgi:hypothetical protein